MMSVNGEIFMKMRLVMVSWVLLQNDELISVLQHCIHGKYAESTIDRFFFLHSEKKNKSLKYLPRHHEFQFLDFTAAITRTGITCICPKPKYDSSKSIEMKN